MATLCDDHVAHVNFGHLLFYKTKHFETRAFSSLFNFSIRKPGACNILSVFYQRKKCACLTFRKFARNKNTATVPANGPPRNNSKRRSFLIVESHIQFSLYTNFLRNKSICNSRYIMHKIPNTLVNTKVYYRPIEQNAAY